MNPKSRVEARVGIFVFIALGILVYFVNKIGDLRLLNSGYNLTVFFGFANGLKQNAPVRVAGVDSGEVRKINVYFDPQTKKTRVEISFWIKKDKQVPRDSKLMINTLGLLGEKYLEVIPGSDYANLFKDGDILLGEDPVSMEEIGNLGRRIATKLEESIESLNKVLKDEELRLSFKQAVGNLNQVSQELSLTLNKINKGEGTIGRFIYDDSLYQNLDIFVNDLKAHPWKLLFRPKEASEK